MKGSAGIAVVQAKILMNAARELAHAEKRLANEKPGTAEYDKLLILKSTSETLLRSAHANDSAK
jgi:hypothetical protein